MCRGFFSFHFAFMSNPGRRFVDETFKKLDQTDLWGMKGGDCLALL